MDDPFNSQIIISICCITYNQVNYLDDLFRGFFSQQTDYPFEVLIHDDASNDGTIEKLRSFESKYSNVKVFYECTNKYSSGINYINDILLPHANGKYVAICEGDDYWIDPHKLQTQVDYMEQHPNCQLTTHAAKVYDGQTNHMIGSLGMGNKNKVLSVFDISSNWSLPTASFIFRKENIILYSKEWHFYRPVGDYPRAFFAAAHGSIYYFGKEMSVYRYLSPNSWTSSNLHNWNRIENGALEWISMLEEMDRATNKMYHFALINNSFNKVIKLFTFKGFKALNNDFVKESFISMSIYKKTLSYIYRFIWMMGFAFIRTRWSGLIKWKIIKHD